MFRNLGGWQHLVLHVSAQVGGTARLVPLHSRIGLQELRAGSRNVQRLPLRLQRLPRPHVHHHASDSRTSL